MSHRRRTEEKHCNGTPVIKEHRIVPLPVYDDVKGVIRQGEKEWTPNPSIADTADYWTTIVSYNGLTEDCYKYLVDLLRIKQYMVDMGYEEPYDFDFDDKDRIATWDKNVYREHKNMTPPSDEKIRDMLQRAEDRFLGENRYPHNKDAPMLHEKLGAFEQNWYFTQKHCIYMFLLQLAGEWGTSVRFGWIEPTSIDKAIDFMIVVADTAGYRDDEFSDTFDLDSDTYEGWKGDGE